MQLVSQNAMQVYRPLWAGIAIMSSAQRRYGSIGCFAVDLYATTWLLTASHVLFDPQNPQAANVVLYQPDDRIPDGCIHTTGLVRTDNRGDVTAIALDGTERTVPASIGIGRWVGIGQPVIGMTVIKAGATTGVTHGVIAALDQDGFDIVSIRDLPSGYMMTAGGDSGAAWMDVETRMIVGFHIGERANGRARARAADPILTEMKLALTH